MHRTALPYAITVLTAIALASIIAGGAASAQPRMQHLHDELMGALKGQATKKRKIEGCYAGGVCLNPVISDPAGHGTQNGPTTHYQFRWWQDYAASEDL